MKDKIMLVINLILFSFLSTCSSFRPLSLRPRFLQQGTNYARGSTTTLLNMSSKAKLSTNVVFEKIIKPTKYMPERIFLPYLVDYLECYFKLPPRLPAVYESHPEAHESGFTLVLDSPLSPAPEETRMEVEVIGIVTDQEDNNRGENNPQMLTSGPKMAMVVVRKETKALNDNAKSKIPAMIRNIFVDSEKRILRALDRGLDDFVSGRVKMEDADGNMLDPDGNKMRSKNAQKIDETIKARFEDEDIKPPVMDVKTVPDDKNIPEKDFDSNSKGEDIIDVVPEPVKKAANKLQKKQTGPHPVSTKPTDMEAAKSPVAEQTAEGKKSNNIKSTPIPYAEDYAIKAAMEAAKTRKSAPKEDFAVSAAKKIAANRPKSTPKGKSRTKSTSEESHQSVQGSTVAGPVKNMEGFTPEVRDSKYPRAFRTTVSTPKDYIKYRDAMKEKTKAKSGENKTDKVKNDANSIDTFKTSTMDNDVVKQGSIHSDEVRSDSTKDPTVTSIDTKSEPPAIDVIKADPVEDDLVQNPSAKSSDAMKSHTILDAEIESDTSLSSPKENQGKQPLSTEESKVHNEDLQIPNKMNKHQTPESTMGQPDMFSKGMDDQQIKDKYSFKTKRKINLRVVDKFGDDGMPVEGDPEPLLEPPKIKKPVKAVTNTTNAVTNTTNAVTNTTKTVTNTAKKAALKSPRMNSQLNAEEREIQKKSMDIMDEIVESNQDLTPEELLKGIMKFDEKMKKENEIGNGFVTGALEKAREVLLERRRKMEARRKARAEGKKIDPNFAKKAPEKINVQEPSNVKEVRELTPEEELRQMFQAGERIAEGKLTHIESSKSKENAVTKGGTTEKEIDELIAADKSVSSHARILDDELVELEAMINPTPGEEFDPPRKNPVFDIMSGPEVYNPNVDPETVNYPGALPGTKEVRLPKELDEAVKQAKFATEVLQRVHRNETIDMNGETITQYFLGKREMSEKEVDDLARVVEEGVRIGLIPNPITLMEERDRLQLAIDELSQQPKERYEEISGSFPDLLLSENFVSLVRERMENMAARDVDLIRRGVEDESLEEANKLERDILGHLVNHAQFLLKKTRALGAQLEVQQLEIVRSICEVAMDPRHVTEEETAAALTDAVREMRPLLDDVFVAFLKYAVAEEEGRLARAGLLDDPEHNQWLFVLKIVQKGVYTEISRGINRYLEHIWYVLRMETREERRILLSKLIDKLPTMDVRPFVQVVENIVGSLGDSVRGDFDGVTALGEMTNKLLQLHLDVKELLPPERIRLMSRDADEWAAKQKERLMEGRKLAEQRLQAAKDTAHFEDQINAMGESSGDVQIFD